MSPGSAKTAVVSGGSVTHGRLVAGLDIGSTGIKLLVATVDGPELLSESAQTPWQSSTAGTVLDAAELGATVQSLLTRAAVRLRAGDLGKVEALAVTGMGESGFAVGLSGEPVAPAFAWFDPRGGEQVAAFPAHIRREFAGRTGLPLGAQVTAAKVAYLRDAGVRLLGTRWLSVPEYVACLLGGEPVADLSLASRTGLLDQDTAEAWPDILDHLGVGVDFLPQLVASGTVIGTATGVPDSFSGARLTVAGHDHLVAAEAAGGLNPDRYHVSLGTAEVLLRVLDAPLGRESRERLTAALINEVHHVVPGKRVLVAGVKTGLLLRRSLAAAGIHDRAGRDRLDELVMRIDPATELPVTASGARNDDGVLRLTYHFDGAGPAETFEAVLRHSNDEIRALMDVMDAEVAPPKGADLTGGWVGMRSVVRARAAVLPHLRVSAREHETAYGATCFAAQLLANAYRR